MRRQLIACLVTICAWAQVGAQPVTDAQRKRQGSDQSAILTAFRKDISVCSAITKVLRGDRQFIESFTPAANRTSKPFAAFLRDSPNSSSEVFQYVLGNVEYFEIDVSMHGYAWAVAWVDGEGIYCAPTFARLKAIEALGESRQAWNVRKFFLDKALQNLEHPSDVMVSGLVDFEQFKSLVLEASKRYSGAQRANFVAWVRTAIKEIEAGKAKIEDGAAQLPASEQNKILDDRIALLRSFASQ